MAVAANVICLWTGTNASIPSGWSRETSLDAKYPKGTAAATNPGTTGGALTHTHTTSSHAHTAAHTHTIPDAGAVTGSTARDTGTTNPPLTHAHTGNPATNNPATSLAGATPSTDAINHEPPFVTVIFIKSDGTPTGLPNGAVALWNEAAGGPSGWALKTASPDMRGRFLKGAAASGDGGSTGGGATHTGHTIASHDHGTNFSHDHGAAVTSSQNSTAATTGSISGANAGTATQTHTHSLTPGTQATDAITGNTDSVGSGANEPPYYEAAYLANTSGGNSIPDKIICLWIGTLASIPTNWVLCDGANGTPDLRGQYVRGATTIAGLGGTGGSLTHTHTATGHTHAVASHTHPITVGQGAGENRTAGATNAPTTAHTHATWTTSGAASFTSGSGTPTVDNQTDTQPPFSTVAFIQWQQPVVSVAPDPIAVPSSVPVPTIALAETEAAVAIPTSLPEPSEALALTLDAVAIPAVTPGPALVLDVAAAPIEAPLVVVEPDIQVGTPEITVNPDPLAIPAVVPEPTAVLSETEAAIEVPTVVPAPAEALAVTLEAVALSCAVIEPTITSGNLVAPDPVTVPTALPQPAMALSLNLTPLAVTLQLPAASVSGGQIVSPTSPVPGGGSGRYRLDRVFPPTLPQSPFPARRQPGRRALSVPLLPIALSIIVLEPEIQTMDSDEEVAAWLLEVPFK